jgi:hypothetical protein
MILILGALRSHLRHTSLLELRQQTIKSDISGER